MPGSDSGKKSINTRDETPHVTATLRDTVQCSLGPVQGAVSALWEYSQSHLNTNAFVKYSNHSLGKEDAVLKVSKLFGSLSQPVHCSIYNRQFKMLVGIQCHIGI